MKVFGLCHRCKKWAVEHLRTHWFCWECNYAPEFDVSLVPWSALEFRNSRIAARLRAEDRSHYEDPQDFSRNEVGGS